MIAHAPAEPRDHARLLVVSRDGHLAHRQFFDLPACLRRDDLLVYNETRVIKARLRGQRVHDGGAVELLVLGVGPDGDVRAMARPARRLRPGTRLRFGPPREEPGHSIEVEVLGPESFRFPSDCDLTQFLERVGEVPLPPYITPPEGLDTARAYQAIFANIPGSVAAPTASLHFTERTLTDLQQRGIELVPIVLTVGLGTFAPVRVARLSEHTMHSEPYAIPPTTAAAINAARQQGRRIVAIGTTVLRALEGAAQSSSGSVPAGSGETELFVTPGFRFQVVDALITNFHVPRSTLMVLVASFAGAKIIQQAYASAITQRYRFFSFGDAMLLER